MAKRPSSPDYDLLIIGSGPAGQKGALAAAKLGARVAIIDRNEHTGGVCLNTGTIPSKSLREAVMFLTGYRQRGYYGEGFRLKERIKAGDLVSRTNHVIFLERQVINAELDRSGVGRITGRARLTGPNSVTVEDRHGHTNVYTANSILVATGTRPRRPPDVPFDTMNVLDSDGLFHNGTEIVPLPDSLIVLGAGIIGIEYASMFGALDIPVILVDPRPNPLSFVDNEIARVLYDKLESLGMELLFGVAHDTIRLLGPANRHGSRVEVMLAGGRRLEADSLLFALGREPVARELGVVELGVELDKRGHIVVDAQYRTTVPSIFAAGDVIGFPALASTSAEQGRLAALNALGIHQPWKANCLPYGVYTIPEISMVGRTQEQLDTDGVDYFVGTALWRETARGKILGDLGGAMKLLFARADRRLLGVHIIGEGATELIHIGQAVMQLGGTIDYFLDNVFNYPTLSEAYKNAAHNAINRLNGSITQPEPLREQVLHGELHENFIRLSGEVRLPTGLF
jgi:NAD(P) transhydrogenase